MIVGHRESIAIEYEVEASATSYMYGHICLWAGGTRIGDYAQTMILTTAAGFLQGFVNASGQRHVPELEALSAEKTLTRVFSVLFDSYAPHAEYNSDFEKRYYKLCVCPGGGEAFDGEFAILLENAGFDRLIWRNKETQNAREVTLAPKQFTNVIMLFLEQTAAWVQESQAKKVFNGDASM